MSLPFFFWPFSLIVWSVKTISPSSTTENWTQECYWKITPTLIVLIGVFPGTSRYIPLNHDVWLFFWDRCCKNRYNIFCCTEVSWDMLTYCQLISCEIMHVDPLSSELRLSATFPKSLVEFQNVPPGRSTLSSQSACIGPKFKLHGEDTNWVLLYAIFHLTG